MKKTEETKTLLQQALGLNSQERTVLLEQIEDSGIRSQLKTLLADEAQRDVFLAENPTQQTTVDLLEPGTLINRIRIIKLLGQGGMGSVYLGFDEKLERQVAIKSIRPEHLKNPATQQRFVREAQILSKINHPSICQLYDYMETDEGDFLVLEYIKGKPLYQVPLSDTEKLQAMSELAAALTIAHEHGIVHRDLKPDNIMITEQGQLKVLDFGIAQSLTQPKLSGAPAKQPSDPALTQQGSLVGTIRYMSPEQAQGKTINTASDLYAMGVITQEIFSHQAAYEVLETDQLLVDVQQGNRIDSSQLPSSLHQLVSRLTLLDPADRPSAAEAQAAFDALVLAPKHKRRKRLKWTLVVITLALLTGLFWQWQLMGNQTLRSQQVKKYEIQILQLVKQSEQIYVLPIHPIDEEIGQLLKQAELLYGTIQYDSILTHQEKKRLQGIIMYEAEYYEQAISLLEAGSAESKWLAMAWSQLYIEKASEFSDEYGLELTMTDQHLRSTYLAPALKYIEEVTQETGKQDPLLDAFVLSQTDTLQSGLAAVNQILNTEHWNKDAVKLKALILSALMMEARESGRWDQARDFAIQTAETYQISTQMARSYPPDYASLCFVGLGLVSDGIHRTGLDVEKHIQMALKACQDTLITQPTNIYAMNLLSRIYILKAQWEIIWGKNPAESLTQSEHWNQQAADIETTLMTSWNLALIKAMETRQLLLNGQNAQQSIEESLALFDQMLASDSEAKPYIVGDMLYVLAQKLNSQFRQKEDFEPTLDQAQDLFEQTMKTPDLMVSEQLGLMVNLASVKWAYMNHLYDLGQDFQQISQEIIGLLDPDSNRVKNEPNQLILLASTHYLLAEQNHANEAFSIEHLEQANQFITQALAIDAKNYYALVSQARIKALQAFHADQSFDTANDLFLEAINLNDKNPYIYQAWAQSLLLQSFVIKPQAAKQSVLDEGLKHINTALSVDPHNPSFTHTKNQLTQAKAAQ